MDSGASSYKNNSNPAGLNASYFFKDFAPRVMGVRGVIGVMVQWLALGFLQQSKMSATVWLWVMPQKFLLSLLLAGIQWLSG